MKKSIKKQLNPSDMEALNNTQLENVAGGALLPGAYFPWPGSLGIWDEWPFPGWPGGGFPGGGIPGGGGFPQGTPNPFG